LTVDGFQSSAYRPRHCFGTEKSSRKGRSQVLAGNWRDSEIFL